jgi:hypothetical protein
MEFHKYVLTSDFYDLEEKKKAKVKLENIMITLKMRKLFKYYLQVMVHNMLGSSTIYIIYYDIKY